MTVPDLPAIHHITMDGVDILGIDRKGLIPARLVLGEQP